MPLKMRQFSGHFNSFESAGWQKWVMASQLEAAEENILWMEELMTLKFTTSESITKRKKCCIKHHCESGKVYQPGGAWFMTRFTYSYIHISSLNLHGIILPTSPAREKHIWWNFAKVKVFIGVGKLCSSSFVPSPTCTAPFCSHCVIICISEWGAQQDAQLHSPNSLLSAAYSWTQSSPSLSKSSMSFSCNYENMSNLFHVPHP